VGRWEQQAKGKRRKEFLVKAHEIKKSKKQKVELTLSTPRTYTGGTEARIHLFFASALDAGQWPTSRPGRFTPRVRTTAPTEKAAGWALESVYTISGEDKIFFSWPGFEPQQHIFVL